MLFVSGFFLRSVFVSVVIGLVLFLCFVMGGV